MKANEFVKHHGWDEAKKALDSCCWMDGSYCTKLSHGCIKNDHDCCIDVTDLKRLVESHELVMDYYGLTRAKEHAESNYTAPEIKDALKQAIADVESCQ